MFTETEWWISFVCLQAARYPGTTGTGWGMFFVMLLFEVKGMQGYPTLHVINIDVLTDVS